MPWSAAIRIFDAADLVNSSPSAARADFQVAAFSFRTAHDIA
jgi:hypothetical protein